MSQAAYHPDAPTTNFTQTPPASNFNQGTTGNEERPSHHIHNPSERLPAAGTPDETSRLYDPANSAANPSSKELYEGQNQGVGNENQSALKGFKTDPNQTNADPNAFDSHSQLRKHDSHEFAQSAAGANAIGSTTDERDPSRPTHFHPNDQSTGAAFASDDKGTGLNRAERSADQHDPSRPTHHHPHDTVHKGEKAAALAAGAGAVGTSGANATHGTNTTSTAHGGTSTTDPANTASTNTAAPAHGTNTTSNAHGTDTADVHDASRHGATGHARDERDHTHGHAAPTSTVGADDRNKSHLTTGATAANVASGEHDIKEGGPAHRHAHHGHPQEETRHFQGTGTDNDTRGTHEGRTGAGLVGNGHNDATDLPEGKPTMMDKIVGKAQKMMGKSKGDQDMEQAGEVRATEGKAAAQEVKNTLNNN